MNESRRNGANRLVMADLDQFWGEGSAPLRIPGKRVCSTEGCNAILSGYNHSDVCSVCRSKQLSGEFERAAREESRRQKTTESIAWGYAVNQGIKDGLLRKCACGCGEVFKVVVKSGRPKLYATQNCRQNAVNRQYREYRLRRKEAQ